MRADKDRDDRGAYQRQRPEHRARLDPLLSEVNGHQVRTSGTFKPLLAH